MIGTTVDCHAHIFMAGAALTKDAWTKPKSNASIAHYHQTLERVGIERAVLAASSLHADCNAYATSVTRSDPNLRTTVIIPATTELDELRILDQSGTCGIRLQLRNKEVPDLRSREYQLLFHHIAELGWHVQLHDDAHRLPPMIEIIEASGVRVVIDHFGRPGPDGIKDPGFRFLLAAVERGLTWVKISAAFRLEKPEEDRLLAEALLGVRGPDRILWGSDWPFVGFEESMTFERALAHFAGAVPDLPTRRAINNTALFFYFGNVPGV